MNYKKITIFLLTLLIISSAALAACAPAKNATDANTPAKDDSTEENAADSGANEPEAEAEEKYVFPDQNYGGYKMRILTPDQWCAMST
jgi:ABC-type oligopeptide transport system substrate-binding subunit